MKRRVGLSESTLLPNYSTIERLFSTTRASSQGLLMSSGRVEKIHLEYLRPIFREAYSKADNDYLRQTRKHVLPMHAKARLTDDSHDAASYEIAIEELEKEFKARKMSWN
jgi:hypothetical protein